MNNPQLPAALSEAINNFFTHTWDDKDYLKLIDNITQDALYTIDKNGSGDGGDTFFFMRSLKDLLTCLKPFAHE
ncbi:hypothetical protein [Agriterribacter sp.]|uniref:hypothetical protein n=1 Tax=Agriterribacter sp. TaxID=2821509 RepID=UPI002CE1FEAE|nr:hypothetical protein [Agriterribacter sp.]HRO47677.1 hypothetical protein [Agriterribacter sp.]HRQ17658.1 hypothetical protein [Agriterribacter sp.]